MDKMPISIAKKAYIKVVQRQKYENLRQLYGNNFSYSKDESTGSLFFYIDTSVNIDPRSTSPTNSHFDAQHLYTDGLDYIIYMQIEVENDKMLKVLKDIIDTRLDFYIKLTYKKGEAPYTRPVFPMIFDTDIDKSVNLIFTGMPIKEDDEL